MCAVFSQQILFDFKIAGLLQSRDVRAKIAVCRADDTLQPREFQLLSRRQRLQCGLDFQAHWLMNKPRVKTCGCGLSLLAISARTFGKGSSWLWRHDSSGNSPRRPLTAQGPCVRASTVTLTLPIVNSKRQASENRGDSTESGICQRVASVWCVLTSGRDGVRFVRNEALNTWDGVNVSNSANP